MVWENGHVLDELLDENPSLGLGGCGPRPVDIEVIENPSHLFAPSADVVGFRQLPPSRLGFAVCRRNGQVQASLLLGKQIGSDPVVVVQAQQLLCCPSNWSTACSEL
jgi:hypothetical protein